MSGAATYIIDDRNGRDPQPADHLVLWLPVFLCCGIGTYFLLPFEPAISILLALFAAIGGIAAMTWRLRDFAVWRWGASFAVMFVFGMALIQWHSHAQAKHVTLLNESVWNKPISGTIESFERVGTGWRLVLVNAAIDGGKPEYTLRLTIRRKGFMPEAGGHIDLKGSVMAPSPPMVPASFDFRRHAFFKGISGYGYATQILEYAAPSASYRDNQLEVYRDWLTEKVYAVLQQPEAGIVTALLNGQRAGIAKKSTEVLQKSGLQHVISISGLHVSLLAITIFFSIRFLLACSMRAALYWPIKKIAAFCALIGIVFYLLIVGNSPPTLRAVLVTGAALCAVMLDREPIQMRVVALAAMAILLIQPESLIDIGFQMSFAAVIGLVAFYQYSRAFWTHAFWKTNIVYKAVLLGIGTIVTSIVATIVTAPLVLMYFQQVPLLSMLANVMASPAISFLVMPGTFLAYLLTPFPIVGDLAIQMMGLGVQIMMDVAAYVAAMPSSVLRIPSLPLPVVVLVMTGLWLLIGLKGYARFSGIAVVIIGLGTVFLYDRPDLYLTSDRVVLYPDATSDALYIDGRMQKFNRVMMLQWTGKQKVQDFPCQDDVCDLNINGQTIRFVRTVPALKQACKGKVDLVVTRYYLDRKCTNFPVLDRHTLRTGGGQAVYIKDGTIRMKSVYSQRKHAERFRPWELNNSGKKQ